MTATHASGYAVATAPSLESLAHTADLVCKATVVSDHAVTDPWFEAVSGYEVRDTELRVISTLKGPAATVVHFRHYAPAPGPTMYAPAHYSFVVGHSYIVLAAAGDGGRYHQLSKQPTIGGGDGVIRAADATPARGKTITEVAWAELTAAAASPGSSIDDAVDAIAELDMHSGGQHASLADFDRHAVLDAIRPLIASPTPEIATAAIAVFGAESPYFDDEFAPFWFAALGKGEIEGMGAMAPSTHPAGDLAVHELLAIADSSTATAPLRAHAIRALGHSPAVTAARVATWLRDPDAAVRAAAVLVSAQLADRTAIQHGATDAAPEVRAATALAIGFTQDAARLPLLGRLLRDADPKVGERAALSLLAFPPAQAAAVMTANLATDYRPLFVNALARHDPQPYLAQLADVIVKQAQPAHWWGGTIPAGVSWRILYGYIKTRPAADVVAGKLDASLAALEQMKWFSSSEPVALYALYLARGLPARAKRFRDATRATTSYDIDQYFDLADKSPTGYLD